MEPSPVTRWHDMPPGDSPEEARLRSFKEDLSAAPTNFVQHNLRSKMAGGVDEDRLMSYEERENKSDRAGTKRLFEAMQRQSWEQAMAATQAAIDRLNRELDTIRAERKQVEQDLQDIRVRLRTLDAEDLELRQQRKDLIAQIKEKKEIVTKSNAEETQALKDRDDAAAKAYPNGQPVGGMQDDPLKAREAELENETWGRTRNAIRARFEEKGLGDDFDTLERAKNGENINPADRKAIEDRLRAAGLSPRLDYEMIKTLPQDDPFHDTLRAKQIILEENQDIAAANRQDFSNDMETGIGLELEKLDKKLSKIEQERNQLYKDGQMTEEKLKLLAQKEARVTAERDKAIEFREWLKSDDVKNNWNNPGISGEQKITLADFINRMPPSMQRHYIDSGTGCEITSTDRTGMSISSAMSGGISADGLSSQFNPLASTAASTVTSTRMIQEATASLPDIDYTAEKNRVLQQPLMQP